MLESFGARNFAVGLELLGSDKFDDRHLGQRDRLAILQARQLSEQIGHGTLLKVAV